MSEKLRQFHLEVQAAKECANSAIERFNAIAMRAVAAMARADTLTALEDDNAKLRERLALLEQEVFNGRGFQP